MIIDEEFKTAFGRKDLCLGLQDSGAEVFDTAPDSFAWIILRRTEKKRNWKPTRFLWPILKAQTDPKFQTAFKYTRITAKVRATPLSWTKVG
ncbi:MAG: hypothetical protein LUO94_03060 [Methylococcaceae bacterium]|nr:hypothetical protein [Methylococcaceae bacterium]